MFESFRPFLLAVSALTASLLAGVASASAQDPKSHCERHFPGQIQGEIRSACSSAFQDFQKLGKTLVDTRCRLNYGDEPRLVMACLIGAAISEDLSRKSDSFKKKHQLCAEHYPAHTEIDAFFQESCLSGIYLPDIMKTEGRAHFENCGQITPERSFIGPCAVGLSLSRDLKNPTALTQQNRLCEQYFDHKLFHIGYRSCLSARSIATSAASASVKIDDALKECSNVVSESGNDTERAACIVGLNISRHLQRQEDVSKRFQKCGENKVSYQGRDFLACLTAASLLELGDRSGAQNGCREVFRNAQTRGRGDCLNSLSLF
jgi:hypothetical protein